MVWNLYDQKDVCSGYMLKQSHISLALLVSVATDNAKVLHKSCEEDTVIWTVANFYDFKSQGLQITQIFRQK